MKKNYLFLLILFSAAYGCTKDNTGTLDGNDTPPDGKVRILASYAGDNQNESKSSAQGAFTRTSLQSDGLSLAWVESDAIGVIMHDGTDHSSSKFTVESISGDKALFNGGLLWGDAGVTHTFYSYYPAGDVVPITPSVVPITIPAVQSQSGSDPAGHIADYGFLVATPVPCAAPDGSGGANTGMVDMQFHHAATIVEFRIAALNRSDVVLESVTFASDRAGDRLAVADGNINVEKGASEEGFAYIWGGVNSNSVKVELSGAPALAGVSESYQFSSHSETAKSSEYPVYLVMCPFDGSGANIMISVKTNKGTFIESKPGKDFARGKKYVSTILLDEDNISSEWGGDQDLTPITFSGMSGVITTAGELAWLAAQVNSGESYSGYNFTLGANIDLQNIPWTPIGNATNSFDGNFDGAGYRVDNLNLNAAYSNSGLFGRAGGTQSQPVMIQNINVSGGATLTDNTGINLGGILGFANQYTTVSGCSFSGNFSVAVRSGSGGNIRIGGIVGDGAQSVSTNRIEYCTSSGSIYVNAGGRFGGMASVWRGEIRECASYMNMSTGTDVSYIGGMCGTAAPPIEISGCRFYGSITGGGYSGGICGDIARSAGATGNFYIWGNANYGDITAMRAAGIIAYTSQSTTAAAITACYNTGTITGTTTDRNIGGILGYPNGGTNGSVTGCYNIGELRDGNTTTRGGIVGGQKMTTISSCYAKYKYVYDNNVSAFSAEEWPEETAAGWGIGDGSTSAAAWKSLGSWNSGNPVYPSLWWE